MPRAIFGSYSYILMKYKRSLRITISGTTAVLPADAVEDICVLLDVCSSGNCGSGDGLAFMMSVPEVSTAAMYVTGPFR